MWNPKTESCEIGWITSSDAGHSQIAGSRELASVTDSELKDIAINKEAYFNPNCIMTDIARTKPFRRCDSCGVKTKNCLGLKVNVGNAICILILVVAMNIESSFVSNLLIFACMIMYTVISMLINRETDRMVEITTERLASMEALAVTRVEKAKAEHEALYDTLTQLPNRRLLNDRLHQLMNKRSLNYNAILFLDLDHFKTLNDTLGHEKGDLLLKQVAERLTHATRKSDTVARLGGDEFVVVLDNLGESEEEASRQTGTICTNILGALSTQFFLDSIDYTCSTSIGAVIFKGNDTSTDDLLKQADLAMYKSKASGRNTFHLFDAGMMESVIEHAQLKAALENALQENQFQLHYQPQVTTEGFVTGAEALLRWNRPEHGIVSPDQLASLKENICLNLPLAKWILNNVCHQLVDWASRPEMAHLTLEVNISVHQFRQPDFVTQIQEILKNSGVNPGRLILGLSEKSLASNVPDVLKKMNALVNEGIRFSLDDFGLSSTSLLHLQQLPISQMKIDRFFVSSVLEDPGKAALVKMIVAVAQSLESPLIAVGVETVEQRDFIVNAGCNTQQGHLFSQALPVTDFEVLEKTMGVH